MASPFDHLDAQVSAAVNAAFGEAVTIRPMTENGRTAPTVDGTREVKIITVQFALAPDTDYLSGARRGSEMMGSSRLNTNAAEAWISAEEASTLGYDLTTGDRIVLHTREGLPVYQISAAPQIYDTGDVNLILVREEPT